MVQALPLFDLLGDYGIRFPKLFIVQWDAFAASRNSFSYSACASFARYSCF